MKEGCRYELYDASKNGTEAPADHTTKDALLPQAC